MKKKLLLTVLITLGMISGVSAASTVTDKTYSHNVIDDEGDGDYDVGQKFIGDSFENVLYNSAVAVCSSKHMAVENLTLNPSAITGGGEATVDIYIDNGGVDTTWKEGTKVKDNAVKTIDDDNLHFDIQQFNVSKGQCYEVEFITESTTQDGDGGSDEIVLWTDDSASSDIYVRPKSDGTYEINQNYGDMTLEGKLIKETPEIDSSSTTPSNWLFGDQPGFTVNVSDSDVGVAANNGTFSGETLHNGAINGASWVDGKYGNALSFDGSDDYVDLPDGSNSFLPKGNTSYSIVVRFKSNSGNNQDLVLWGDNSNNKYAGIQVRNCDTVRFLNYGTDWSYSGIDYCDGEYHSVGSTHNPSKSTEQELYFDGSQIGSNNRDNLDIGNNIASIGRNQGFNTNFVNGKIDSVLVYNRSLSSSEFSSIHSSNKYIREGLVGYWGFNAGSGSTAFDTHHRVSRFNKDTNDGGVSFDGSDDYVDIPDELTSNEDTFTLYSSFSSENDADGGYIVGEDYERKALTLLSDGRLRFSLHDSDGNRMRLETSESFNDGQIHSVTGVHDNSTGAIKLYVDGDLKVEKTFQGPIASANPLLIGKYSSIPSWYKGKIYETCIWNTSLSSSEVSKISSEGCLKEQEGLQAAYTFDNATGRYADSRGLNVLDYSIIPKVKLDVLEDGTEIVSDAFLELESWYDVWGSHKYSISDAFTVDEANVLYEATLTALDKTGLSNSVSFSQTVQDANPVVSVNKPSGKEFNYDRSWSFSTSDDGDETPNEQLSCNLNDGSGVFKTVSLQEGESASGSFRKDLGTHTFTVSCTEQKGDQNTANDSSSYTVKASEIQDVYAASPVYETENRTFELDLKTGDMVNSVDFSLYYDNQTEDTKSMSSNGVETLRPDLYHEIPLVSNNQTTKNWQINYSLNITDFGNSTTSTVQNSTSSQNQDVLWSYYIENADTVPGDGDYIETEDLKHDVKLHTETKKASLDGTTTYNRDNSTDSMSVETNATKYTTLRGVLDVGKADTFNQSSFTTESSIDISFNGGSRSLTTGTDTVEVYKIRITDGSTNLNTAKSLVFDVDYEENGYDTKTKLTLDLSVWKNRDEKIRRYQFQEDAAKTHEFYIYPAWAKYKIRTLPYRGEKKFDLIQYFNQDKDKVRRSYFFPTVQTISDTTTTVPLKTINQSEANSIDFEITNSDGDPAQNVYCRVDRKFGGGDFETVFMIKTGSEGKSQSFAEVNEIYYSFTCYKNGEIADQFAAQIMQDPMRLDLGGETVQTSLNYNSKFDASCTSNTTQLDCSYQSQTEKLKKAVLTVDRNEVKKDIEVCKKSSPTVTGKLVCKGLNTTANSYNYKVIGQYPSADTQGASGFLGTQDKPFPAAGLFMTAILFMLTTASTAFDLRIGIASGTLVFLLTNMIDWIVLNPSQQATLIGVAIIAGVAVSQ